MAITKINTPELFDFSATNTALQLPAGDTASRPTSPSTGEWRYNTTFNRVEYYDGSAWFQIDDEALPVACTTDTINYPSGTTNTAYYKMSDATDSTLNAYNGTATSVDFNVQGKFGNAGEFNGSSSVIDIPLNVVSPASAYTVSLWFNCNDITVNQGIFTNIGTSTQAGEIGINITGSNQISLYSATGTSNNVNILNVTPSTSLSNDTWFNLVVISDRTLSNRGQVFINGTEGAYSYNPGPGSNGQYSTAKIGVSDNRYFDGSLDQVRIFNSALTAANVTSLYNEVQCVPAIIPSDYFNPVLWTGASGTPRTITGVGFTPDFIWGKSRSYAYPHGLYDSVRGFGSTKALASNFAGEEGSSDANEANFQRNGFINANNSDGFVVQDGSADGGYFGTSSSVIGGLYVAWNWKAGGAASNVTSSSSAVSEAFRSANADAGFSIVKYVQNGNSVVLPHGLDTTPSIIIVKKINASSSWFVYNNFISNKGRGFLESTSAFDNSGVPTFTSTNIEFQNQDPFSPDPATAVMYSFANVPGYSDIGSYIGLGSSANPVIVTGFRPAFVMIKNTTTGATSWVMADNRRGYADLYANDVSAEFASGSLYGAHFLSNGFTTNTADVSRNASGNTYIYLAIAEQVYNANGVTANQTNPFNDGSQIAQYEFEGNATDSQPNGYIGKGGTFNGTSSYIETPTIIPNNNFTFSCWVNMNSLPAIGSYQVIYNSDVAYQWYISLHDGGKIEFWNGANEFTTASEVITTGQWYNITYTASSSTGKKLYVDGTEVLSNSNTANNVTASGTWQGFGKYLSNSLYFDGSLDQVRIYNTVLNPNDAWLLYSETSATSSTLDYPASTGAQALYELEGDATSTSSSTYDGAATAVAWVPLYDGTDGGTVTYAAPSVSAPFLKAAVFNGSTSIIRTDLNSGSNNLTYSAWINITAAPSQAYGNIVNGRKHFYTFLAIGQNRKVWLSNDQQVSGDTGDSGYATESTTVLSLGVWYHIVGTLSSTDGGKIYINGILNNSSPNRTANAPAQTAASCIGSWEASAPFNGKIDQVRVFNKALDSGEILQLYNEPNN